VKYNLEKSSLFKNNSKRIIHKHPELSVKLFDTLKSLSENPFDTSLKTHKLNGTHDEVNN